MSRRWLPTKAKPSPTSSTAIPHTRRYLIAEEDRMINPATQKFMADRMNAHTRSHTVDHAPLITRPDVVTEILSEAVQTVATPH
jgi:hypothetical protein